MSSISPEAAQRRRMVVYGGPLVLVAIIAFVVGLVVSTGSADLDAAKRFTEAWRAQDFEAMHAELTPAAAQQYSTADLESAYMQAQETATITGIGVGDPRGPIDEGTEKLVAMPLEISTDAFGIVTGELGLPVEHAAIAWRPNLVFPGLEVGEQLAAKTKVPKRAPILARDRSPLAEGPVDARTTNGAGGIVTGEIGAPPMARAKEMAAEGFPDGTQAGNSGLELAFDGALAGVPGGRLLAVGDAGQRVLASAEPQPGKPLRTTIDADLQDAAAAALGDLFGGVAVLDASNGEVRALAGIAFSAPQPPGSTFKIITLTAALDAGVTSPSEEFPVSTSAIVGGREIANAHDEPCGGTLVQSFADSCNSVFAPLGAEVGGAKLVDTAEKFGFNQAPGLYNTDALAATQPAESTIPNPLSDQLDVGVSAIGQGEVQATPLELASIAQTIANKGVRSPTSLVTDPALSGNYDEVQVTSPKIADQVRQMMIEVVNSGTAQAAAIPGVVVAGKTGTAELGPKPGQQIDPNDPNAELEQEVDAWFTSFAPADDPKLAVAVMIVNASGDGGVVAAPIARQVLLAGL